jgi:hypothetical protein
MMHAQVTASEFVEELHPRAQDGKFGSGGQKSTTTPARKATPKRRRRRVIPAGQLGFDGVRGTGYGHKGGDPRVKTLQRELNRLGLLDAHGHKLKIDGKLGPLTTSAIQAAQLRLGMRPTGVISPAFIDRLAATRVLPALKHAPAKTPRKTVKAAAAEVEDAEDDDLDGEEADSDGEEADDADEAEAPEPVFAAELRGIELARPGTWKLSSGTQTFTEAHLHDAARYAQRPGARPSPVKIGHVDPRFDGEPALGWVGNVRVEDRNGPVLIGDITGMPDWLAASAKDAWPDRSVEGWLDFKTDDGEEYSFVVEALALLGVTPPGMSSIQSLRDLPKAVGIAAASGVRVVASMASAPVAVEEGAGPMDPAKIREALGLSADAPDDEVGSALVVAAQGLVGDAGPAQQPVQASLFGDEQQESPSQKAKGLVVPPGMKLVSASAYDEREEAIKTLMEFVAQSKREKRDEVIAQAVRAGKFTPAQKPNFVKLWDADPEGTAVLIESLTPNTALAVAASGYAGDVDNDALDTEYRALFGPLNASRGA